MDSNRDDASNDDRIRTEHFDTDQPIEIEIEVGAGRVDVRLLDGRPDDGAGVEVELRTDPERTAGWPQGLSGLLSWFSGSEEAMDLAAAAVREAEVSCTAGRLVVRSAQALPLRMVPLLVVVRAPTSSQPAVRSGAATVTVTGCAAKLAVRTGSGDVVAERVDGDVEVQTGSGSVRLGPVLGRLRARSGSGGIDAVSLAGPAELTTGSGDVRLGAVSGDVAVRTGSGDLAVNDAASGSLELSTGSGELRVGVRAGVLAEVDLSSGSGRAHSDLEVSHQAPSDVPTLLLRGRTGSGNALVTTAG